MTKLRLSIGVVSIAVSLTTGLFVLANCQKRATVQPVALGAEEPCAYCKMTISEKRYAAQFIDNEGKAFKFDDISCMVNSLKQKRHKDPVRAHFVMDYHKQEWTRAENAFYIRTSEITTPMHGGLVAFKNESEAKQAAAKYHGTLLRFADVTNSKK